MEPEFPALVFPALASALLALSLVVVVVDLAALLLVAVVTGVELLVLLVGVVLASSCGVQPTTRSAQDKIGTSFINTLLVTNHYRIELQGCWLPDGYISFWYKVGTLLSAAFGYFLLLVAGVGCCGWLLRCWLLCCWRW